MGEGLGRAGARLGGLVEWPRTGTHGELERQGAAGAPATTNGGAGTVDGELRSEESVRETESSGRERGKRLGLLYGEGRRGRVVGGRTVDLQWRPSMAAINGAIRDRERGGGRERESRQFPVQDPNGRGANEVGRGRPGASVRAPGGGGWEKVGGRGEEGGLAGPYLAVRGRRGIGARLGLVSVRVRVSGFSFSLLFFSILKYK
jgi:hypothetical protein